MKKIIIILAFCFSLITTLNAQYLTASRSATIKTEPSGKAAILERVSDGDNLVLLDNGQQRNGYYRVKCKTLNNTGWIYRTLVRRYEGQIPGSLNPAVILKFNPPPSDYYSGAENLTGDSLKAELHYIIKEHREFSYGDAWDILKETDIDTLNPENVIGIYSGFSMVAEKEYDGSKGWNREHVWAKSYGDFGTKNGAGTDIHHLRAEDVSTNSARNNRCFDDAADLQYLDNSGNYKGGTNSYTSASQWIWEPRDEVKGDVARMLFYMAVRYEGEDDEPDLELTEQINDKSSKYPVHGKLSVLLKWHNDDPVSNYERYRNDIIYNKYQRNRNPFIDHPEYVLKIWGN